MSKYSHTKYQISERNGKYGVNFLESYTGESIVVLQPTYASVTITNTDMPLSESVIQEYERDESVHSFGEYNCQNILADGKHGLLFNGKLLSPLEYERIIKLTFCHYLCQKNASWELYHHIGICFELQAPFSMPDELTLSGLLHTLGRIKSYLPKDSQDTAALEKRLYKNPDSDDSRYISEYRHYWGFQQFGSTSHDFIIFTERVFLHEDFSIVPYDRVYPKPWR